jgi:hypothetical protein
VKAAGVAVLVVVTLGGVGYAGARWGYPAVTGVSCGSGALQLHVTAAPDIAPALTKAADQWNATKPHAGGECVRAVVTAVATGTVVSDLTSAATAASGASAAPSVGSLPPTDIWVPDSSAWIEQVKSVDSTTFDNVTKPIASSPVVLAVPKASAATVGLTKNQISQKTFLSLIRQMRNSDLAALGGTAAPSKFQLGMADPATDAAALAAATLITGLDHAAQNGLPENAALIADFRFISPVGQQSATAKDLLGSFVAKVDNVPPMTAAAVSEQATVAHNLADPNNPLSPVYIDGFPLALDYPIATMADRTSAIGDAATAFAAAMASPDYRSNFAAAGFRGPDGTQGTPFPAMDGIANAAVETAPLGYNDQTQPSLRLWAGANEEARVLTMVNLGSTMGTATAGGGNRLQLTAASAIKGLGMFTPGSSVGVWGFAPGLGKNDYKEVVPIDVLGTNMPKVQAGFTAAKPAPVSGCGLYPALASAYGMMRDGYSPGQLNTIVVFTDCADAPPGNTMNRSALEATLSNMVDPSNSIGVIIINVGSPSIEKDLQGIASTVGGAAVTLTAPDQIVEIFMRSLVVLS